MKVKLRRAVVACAALVVATPAIAGAEGAKRHGVQVAIDEARATVSQMALRSELIFKLLRDARQARDGRSAPCLDDALSQAHAVERNGEDEALAIERAAKIGDDHALQWRGQRLKVLAKHSEDLLAEAKHCGKRR